MKALVPIAAAALALSPGQTALRFEPLQPALFAAGGTLVNAFADIDGDDDLDLFVGFNGAPNRLYRNGGGTFTDITFTDAETGARWVAKTPSTPGDLSTGFITAVRKVLALAGRTPDDVVRVFHGTTTATNAILEGKTPPTALVTTSGFKYVLEIGRHDIPRHGNLYGWSKPTRPITPERVFEVAERLDVDGSVLIPLDEPAARALARQIGQLGMPAGASRKYSRCAHTSTLSCAT